MGDEPARAERDAHREARGEARAECRTGAVRARRDPAPGDEASVTAQAILFRRGVFYTKLIADPEAPADPEPLMTVAASLDRSLSGAAGARLLTTPEPSPP